MERRLFVALPEFAGSASDAVREEMRKMGDVVVPDGLGDLRDGGVRLQEKFGGADDTALDQVSGGKG